MCRVWYAITDTQVHVTGKTANDWFRVEQSEGDVYISGKLLGMEKAVVQQSSGGGSGQQSSGGNGGGGTSVGEPEIGHVIGENESGVNDAVWGGTIDYSGF